MKSIICDNPGQFRMLDSDKPVLSRGNAIVRIKRIGICGTDLHAFRGRQPFFVYPRILGHELSGIIEEIDANVEKLHLGDLVTIIPYLECGSCAACRKGKPNCCTHLKVMGVHIDGGMREYVSVPVSHLIKANDLSPEAAAIVECLSIGAHAVRRAGIKLNEKVLVIGAGPIGLGVMKYAKLSGAMVIAMDVNEERLQFCKQWSRVHATVTGGAEDKLMEVLDGELPDIVLDATGNKASMESSFRFVANGGRLIFVGLVKSEITFDDPLFHSKELTLMSSRNATREDFDTVLKSMRDGQIDTNAFITHQSRYSNMIDEFERWLDPANKVIKAMVELD